MLILEEITLNAGVEYSARKGKVKESHPLKERRRDAHIPFIGR